MCCVVLFAVLLLSLYVNYGCVLVFGIVVVVCLCFVFFHGLMAAEVTMTTTTTTMLPSTSN
jgi:hypothetical protein